MEASNASNSCFTRMEQTDYSPSSMSYKGCKIAPANTKHHPMNKALKRLIRLGTYTTSLIH
nr:hypothetical protein [Escherichia coli]